MKIKALHNVFHRTDKGKFNLRVGDELDLPAAVARALIKAGHAVPVQESPKVTEQIAEAPVKAAATPATRRRRKKA